MPVEARATLLGDEHPHLPPAAAELTPPGEGGGSCQGGEGAGWGEEAQAIGLSWGGRGAGSSGAGGRGAGSSHTGSGDAGTGGMGGGSDDDDDNDDDDDGAPVFDAPRFEPSAYDPLTFELASFPFEVFEWRGRRAGALLYVGCRVLLYSLYYIWAPLAAHPLVALVGLGLPSLALAILYALVAASWHPRGCDRAWLRERLLSGTNYLLGVVVFSLLTWGLGALWCLLYALWWEGDRRLPPPREGDVFLAFLAQDATINLVALFVGLAALLGGLLYAQLR